MIRKKHSQSVPTVFRNYFPKHRLNIMVKNLYIDMSGTLSLFHRVRINLNEFSSFFITILFRRQADLRKKIDLIDLSALNETLAVYMNGNSKNRIRINSNSRFKCEQMNISEILNRQSQLLRNLISEQRNSLKEQSKIILEKEKERIQEKINSNNHRNTRK